ncbi:MAG: right-handed parallel beta-helix repeat-containing protein, partial [Deltaproteobacteria bacterium]|nr:right-handed parallel beta-helix repeat-containing protein [Deltaproteobacteria bacterium]
MKTWGVLVLLVSLTISLVSLTISLSFLPLSVTAVEYGCNTCAGCNGQLSNPELNPGDIIEITEDISASGDCIVYDNTVSDITLNCNNNVITGSGSGTGIAVSQSLDINNCIVTGFDNGIVLKYPADSASITDSNITDNGIGISILASSSNTVSGNFIIDNDVGLKTEFDSRSNIIYNNYFDNTDNVVLQDQPDSLFGYWSFENYDSNGVNDDSSNSNIGTFNGGLSTSDITTGKFGNGLEFDGDDDYVYCGDVSSTYDSATVSFWVNRKIPYIGGRVVDFGFKVRVGGVI